MRVIVLADELERSYSVDFDKRWLLGIAALAFVLCVSLVILSINLYHKSQNLAAASAQIEQMQASNFYDQRQLDNFYQYTQGIFREQAKQLGLIQARIVRLEALGSQLAERADFAGEFDFDHVPAVGGPDNDIDRGDLGQMDIDKALVQLNIVLDSRQQGLLAIDDLLNNKKLKQERYIAGRPAASGWFSSRYGKRIDPFTGHIAWHGGIDYASKEGSDILAVAAGVVVWSGERYGYGNMVEINHGDGFITRYGHAEKLDVKIGQFVKKGQVIAQMGSTGRSTGPHVHFEVLKDGHTVDPRPYIYRKSL